MLLSRILWGISVTWPFCRSNFDLDEPCDCTRSINPEPGHADRKTESAWPGTAWIEEKNSIATFNGRPMRMAGDDNLNSPAAVLRKLVAIVQHQDGNIFHLNCLQL